MFSPRSITITVLLFEAFAIVTALIIGAKEGEIIEPFEEGELITWLSFYQLLIISGLSWRIFALRGGPIRPGIWRSSKILWAVVALGFVFLAFDEIGEIHEQLDKLVHRLSDTVETPLTDRLDDAFVGLYGLIGISLLYYYRDEWTSERTVVPFFIGGFSLLFVMVGFDAWSNVNYLPPKLPNGSPMETLQTWLSVLEESFKVFAEGLFIAGFYRLSEIPAERRGTQPHSALLAGGILTLLSIAAFGNAFQYINLVLHISVTILVYATASRIGLSWGAALVAAALFAVHPLHADAVASDIGRRELLMALGVLLSLGLYIRGGAPGRLELGYAMGSLATFFMALLSRARAAVLPALLFLYDVYAWNNVIRRKHAAWRAMLRYAGYLLVFVGYFGLRAFGLGTAASFQTQSIPFVDNPLAHLEGTTRWLTALKVAGKYLWLFAWPQWLAADYSYNAVRPAVSLWDPGVVAALAVWGCLLYWALWSYFKGSRQAFFAVGFTCLTFLPASNFLLPVEAIMAERFFYLPAAGLCFLAGIGWDRAAGWAATRGTIHQAARIGLCGFAIVLLLLSGRAIRRNQDWKGDYALAKSGVRTTPGNAKAHYLLGSALHDRQKTAEALRELGEAFRIYPDYLKDPLFVEALVSVLVKTGHIDEAIRLSTEAISSTPESPGLYHHLGIAYQEKGLWREAESAHGKALSLLENSRDANPLAVADILDNLAKIYALQGKHAQSEQYLLKGLSTIQAAYGSEHPSTAKIIGHLAMLHSVQGDYTKAERYYRRSLEILEQRLGREHPVLIQYLQHYAAVLRKTGREADAIELEERAKALRPGPAQ